MRSIPASARADREKRGHSGRTDGESGAVGDDTPADSCARSLRIPSAAATPAHLEPCKWTSAERGPNVIRTMNGIGDRFSDAPMNRTHRDCNWQQRMRPAEVPFMPFIVRRRLELDNMAEPGQVIEARPLLRGAGHSSICSRLRPRYGGNRQGPSDLTITRLS